METLPIELGLLISRYTGINEITKYRTCSKNSKKYVEDVLTWFDVKCNNKVFGGLNMFANVRKLDLQECRCITNESLSALTNIETINLRSCYRITDNGLEYLSNIKEINLSGCYEITDSGLRNLNKAVFVDISNCPQITVKGIVKFGKNASIVIDNCPLIKSKHVNLLIDIELVKITRNNHPFLSYKPRHIYEKSTNNHIMTHQTKIDKPKFNIDDLKFSSDSSDSDLDAISDVSYVVGEVSDDDNSDSGSDSSSDSSDDNSDSSDDSSGKNTSKSTITKTQKATVEYANDYISKRINSKRKILFDKIYYHPINKRDDIFMKNYEDLLPNDQLNSRQESLNRLFEDKDRKNFTENLKNKSLDILIGGSMGLYCVYKNTNFKPNDIDLYIKDINLHKIKKIENAIYKSFLFDRIVVVNSPITITWYLQLKSGKITSIQLNKFNIKSWAEMFITYHTDLTCIGYEIITDRFVYMKKRWDRILTKNKHYFSCILNLDTASSIRRSCHKYAERGFNCVCINTDFKKYNQKSESDDPFYDDDDEPRKKSKKKIHKKKYPKVINQLMISYYGIEEAPSSLPNRAGSLGNILDDDNFVNTLINKYKGIKNISFSSSIRHFKMEKFFPDIMMMCLYKVNKYMKYPDNSNGTEFHQFSIEKKKNYIEKTKKFFDISRSETKISHESLKIKCLECCCYIYLNHLISKYYSNIHHKFSARRDSDSSDFDDPYDSNTEYNLVCKHMLRSFSKKNHKDRCLVLSVI
ncbi:putative F-box/LRR-repeat protein [Acanthamoeba polyphaga mimivirus]|nr:putative F-box/LRR-repeat protein [Mimivirus reunion]WMV62134.1 putative F-box/LRR-repeat protein [Mimivirus sp.]WMV63111.1 putative F-box/LRR-repeat protein [Acanthamoeba polyphaga mimivirus]WMV64088.1 putative F-box/LRR-repeat protein [Mimivirus sp.]